MKNWCKEVNRILSMMKLTNYDESDPIKTNAQNQHNTNKAKTKINRYAAHSIRLLQIVFCDGNG